MTAIIVSAKVPVWIGLDRHIAISGRGAGSRHSFFERQRHYLKLQHGPANHPTNMTLPSTRIYPVLRAIFCSSGRVVFQNDSVASSRRRRRRALRQDRNRRDCPIDASLYLCWRWCGVLPKQKMLKLASTARKKDRWLLSQISAISLKKRNCETCAMSGARQGFRGAKLGGMARKRTARAHGINPRLAKAECRGVNRSPPHLIAAANYCRAELISLKHGCYL